MYTFVVTYNVPYHPPNRNTRLEERNTNNMNSKKNVGAPLHESYEPPMARLFALSVPQDILVEMSIELEIEDFEEGEPL